MTSLAIEAGPFVTPPDAEAGGLVHAVVAAVDGLEDALGDPDIRASLTGLDAYAMEKVIERLQTIIEEIDNG